MHEETMEPEAQKKKPYASPTITKITPEEARKFAADHKKCSEEEAAEFLKSLRKHPPSDVTNQKRKRSA
jgi:hypothetical protein